MENLAAVFYKPDFTLGYPVGQHVHNQIWILSIVRLQMHRKVMRTIHTFVHHENAGLDRSAFAGLENHRTDGQIGRSASLQYFNVGLVFEAQRTRACVGDLDGKGFVHAKLHITKINLLLIDGNGWCSAASIATLSGEEESGDHHEHATQRYQ